MKTKIKIHPAPENLTGYTHANLAAHVAESLAATIEEIEATGAKVIHARSARLAVPTCYRSAYKMHAPYWVYNGEDIYAHDGTLETRPHGRTIPPQFTILGSIVPPGFRCFKREGDTLLVRPS